MLHKFLIQPLHALSRTWNKVWKVSAKRLPVKTLELVILMLTLALVFLAFWFAQAIVLWIFLGYPI
jgi:hypothetical protein